MLYSRLFILDDVAPFGIVLPKELIEALQAKQKTAVLDAQKLANELSQSVPEGKTLTPIGRGGVITTELLRRAGTDNNIEDPIRAKRTYVRIAGSNRPVPKLDILWVPPKMMSSKEVYFVDDIVASGYTVYECAGRAVPTASRSVFALMLSGDTDSKYRCPEGSTIRQVQQTYSAQIVDYENGKPAILSVRYLLEQARSNPEYFWKYVPEGRQERVLELLRQVDAAPLSNFLSAQTITDDSAASCW